MRHRFESAAVNLRRLYAERVGDSMTQKEFGQRIGISQSMVALILSGSRPLPIDLASKFARELHCTIYDICPEMATYLREEVMPMLGKAMRRAAVVLLSTLALFVAAPQPGQASEFDKRIIGDAFFRSLGEGNMHCVSLLSRFMRRVVRSLTQLFGNQGFLTRI